MPFIRVNCPKGALTADQKAKLAPILVNALIREEIDPVTEIGTAATGFFYNEIDVSNCFPGGVPLSEHPEKMFWTVEAFVAASFFSQPRRDEMQIDIAKAFVCVWQAGLAHFGSLFWPTPGTLKVREFIHPRSRRGGGNVGIAVKRFPRSVGRLGKQFHRFSMLSIDRHFHRRVRLTSLFGRHRVAG
jgi:phenylpyruvate tautomerase PptA (4-oxalocrotonate tautomerase family)